MPLRTVVAGNPALRLLEASRSALFLQGPIGPLFDRIGDWKRTAGGEVHRIVFDAGSELFCRRVRPHRYTGTLDYWPAALAQYIRDTQADVVVLFGQGRPYHQRAIETCRRLGLPVIVVEEGYIRPGFVTMEIDGVNGHSTTLDRFELDRRQGTRQPRPAPATHQFLAAALWAALFYLALTFLNRRRYPHYVHHRETRLASYALHWLQSGLRKLVHSVADRLVLRRLFAKGVPFFFVPLQVDGDSQMTLHSPFADSLSFTRTVLQSFAAHAPAHVHLVIKQHPMGRGSSKAGAEILVLAQRLQVADRVHFIHEAYLPGLLRCALGVVTINSTVGLQAVFHRRPLKVLGDALYRQPGVTAGGTLDEFWSNPETPHWRAAQRLYDRVRSLTQVPAALYDHWSRPLSWTTGGRTPITAQNDAWRALPWTFSDRSSSLYSSGN